MSNGLREPVASQSAISIEQGEQGAMIKAAGGGRARYFLARMKHYTRRLRQRGAGVSGLVRRKALIRTGLRGK